MRPKTRALCHLACSAPSRRAALPSALPSRALGRHVADFYPRCKNITLVRGLRTSAVADLFRSRARQALAPPPTTPRHPND